MLTVWLTRHYFFKSSTYFPSLKCLYIWILFAIILILIITRATHTLANLVCNLDVFVLPSLTQPFYIQKAKASMMMISKNSLANMEWISIMIFISKFFFYVVYINLLCLSVCLVQFYIRYFPYLRSSWNFTLLFLVCTWQNKNQ